MTTKPDELPRSRPGRGDRGVVLILVALAMLVIIAFVAFAVDIGRVYGERRQDQAAVDSGALSGAFQMLLTTQRTEPEIFDQVTAITYDSLDPQTRPSTLAAWRAAWPGCTDAIGAASAKYSGGAIRNGSGVRINCIRKSSDGKALRVKLPTRTIDTFFAGALGFDTLSASATAEAGLTAIDTGVLPFALSATNTAGTVTCLKQPPTGLSVSDVCPGSSRGVFGYLSSPRPSWDSNQACNGGQNLTIQQNIAQGLDHNLTPWVATNVTDVCTNGVVIGVPNTLSFQTGNIAPTIEDGFITARDEGGSFADGGPARLSRPSPCVIQGGSKVRSLPQQPSISLEWCGVWDYMLNVTLGADPATQVPPACYDLKNQISSQNLAGVRLCFDQYAAGGYTSRLFDISLRTANRFGWIPESIEDLDGTRTFRIQRFRATFVQTIYYERGNNYVAYNPGEALPNGCGNCNNFSSITSLVFDSNMLPPEIRTPGSDNNIESSIALIK